ncbi:ESX secretion-associated protein EspG [Rhodococcus sp. NBC_00297]|uniref:ESX secretion-associated protein EspG n=1 Tax=Rhodococcus sp. NBC_00297 TaxID=2976005 RepID=UPI002E2E6821|nr:ESX secretion-associated protein EspG [Rhodococcus sp. NBC_00297]
MIVRAAPTGVASWHLTSLEFAVLLDRIGRDRVPFPFSWTTRARTAADLRAEREAARRRLGDRSLLAAASLLGGPGLQVTACGVESGDRRVRIRAATSYSAIPLHSDRPPAFPLAVVVVQDPRPTSDTGGTVHVHAVPPERMTHTLTAALPHRRAGRVTPSSVSRDDVVRAPSSHLHDSRGDTDRDRVIHILDGPREGLGEIVVGHGGDGPLEAIAGRRWIDALGDGRYLVHATDVVAVLPATAQTIAAALDDEIRRAGAVPPVTGTRS